MRPLISIIIPTFNRSQLLGETLESIIAQTYTNWECIVVDDWSTDYTKELMDFFISKDSRISYLIRPTTRPKGANACRNYGFEISKGAYINWFDDDDIMHPEKLERQLNVLENSSFQFSICQSLVFENNLNNIIGFKKLPASSENVFQDYLKMKISWLTQVPLWKRDFLIDFDYSFDEQLQAAQEWEFHLRVLNKFPKYAIINEGLVFIRKHKESITYNENEEQRFYYYFQSRLIVYRNEDLNLSLEDCTFLQEYLLKSFKKMIITNNRNVFKAYKIFILPDKNILSKSKVNALLAIGAFKIFKKGNLLLQEIKYS